MCHTQTITSVMQINFPMETAAAIIFMLPLQILPCSNLIKDGIFCAHKLIHVNSHALNNKMKECTLSHKKTLNRSDEAVKYLYNNN